MNQIDIRRKEEKGGRCPPLVVLAYTCQSMAAQKESSSNPSAIVPTLGITYGVFGKEKKNLIMAAYIFTRETRNLWPCGVFISTGFHRDRRDPPFSVHPISTRLCMDVRTQVHADRDVDGIALAAGLANNQQQ